MIEQGIATLLSNMTPEGEITMTHASKLIEIHLHRIVLLIATTFMVFGLTGWTVAGAGTGECSSQVVPMESDGTSGTVVKDEKYRAELGEEVKYCIYQFGSSSLEQVLSNCIVISVTFEGTKPAPRLISIVNGWDLVVEQAEVTQSDEGQAWSWTGNGLNYNEPGYLDSGTFSIRLLGSGFGLSDGVETCPTGVQARFRLKLAS